MPANCFANFSDTLREVFGATVTNEDELSYASATLILAGLLQVHVRTPRYASHQARMDSFPSVKCKSVATTSASVDASECTHHPPCTQALPSPNEFASAGFFHTGLGDETVCPSCGLGLRDWQASDQPEACHMAYSTAATTAIQMDVANFPVVPPQPAMPCLYLVVHRLLVSDLPLRRKCLPSSAFSVSRDPAVTVNKGGWTLEGGVIDPLLMNPDDDNITHFPSLAERLRAIVQIMSAPPTPQGWPVQNARELGHSDDLIVLGLWRLQAETAGLGLACPPLSALYLDPHATADLLRAILRLQEGYDEQQGVWADELIGGLAVEDRCDVIYDDDNEAHVLSSEDQSVKELPTAEDAETAALSSRCRPQCQRIRPSPQLGSEVPSSPPNLIDANLIALLGKRGRLPRFYQFLTWWANRWPSLSSEAENPRS